MIGLILALINLGCAIWNLYCINNYRRAIDKAHGLGRMEGFVEGIRCATEGNAKIKDNVIVLN